MQRRKFLTSTLASTLVLTASAKNSTSKPPKKAFVVKNGEARNGTHTPFRGTNPNDVKISGKDTDGQLAMFEYIGNEKVGPSLHIHHEQDEFFQIIKGDFLFQVGDEKFKAQAGDMVFAPRGIPHTWVQLSEKSHIIYGVQPAGKLEEFFVKMNGINRQLAFEEVQQIHKEHGMTIVGNGLKAE